MWFSIPQTLILCALTNLTLCTDHHLLYQEKSLMKSECCKHFKKDSKQGAKSFWGCGPWTSQGNWGIVNVINNIEHIYEMFEELKKCY